MAEPPPLRVAMILADDRDERRHYELSEPFFGTAPTALLQGLTEMPGEIELHILACVRRRMVSPEKLAPNVWFHPLLVPRWGWLRMGYVPCIWAVRRAVARLMPAVVHGQGTERYQGLCAVYSGRPSLLTIHGNMRGVARANGARPFSFLWLTAKLETWAVRRTGGIMCLTDYTRRMVKGDAWRTWTVPNAVDPAFFEVARRAGSDPAVILCVGTIVQHKNQHHLIRALDRVAAERPIQLVFLGEAHPGDPYGAEFRALVAARPWCSHEGFADRDALKKHLSHATLLALPSLEDNCPMVALEAMAAGLPVAAARIGGVPDLVDEGVTGLLFDPLAEDQIRAAILALLDEPARAGAMGDAGKRAARERFHPEVIARAHVAIYRELLAERGKART